MAKRLIVIGGPNGAGKTTFARDYLQEYPADFLSADDLALKISPDHPESAKIEADVPESDILRRFFRSKENFWRLYRDEVDLWFLFYNSGARFEIVAFGEADDYEVNDEKTFNIFLKDLK